MKILMIGQAGSLAFGPPAQDCGAWLHGSNVRIAELGRALTAQGHAPMLVSHAGLAPPGLPTDVRHGVYDVVLIVGIAGVWNLRSLPALDEAVRGHRAVAVLLDTIYGDDNALAVFDFATAIGVSNANAVAIYEQHCPAARVFHAPWCCTPQAAAPNPWERPVPCVLFAGTILPRYVWTLNQLAKLRCASVWVAGLFLVDGRFGGLTRAQRRTLLHPQIHLASDLFGRVEWLGLEGPALYRHVCAMAQHAAVGVNLTPAAEHSYMGPSCKVYDYLAAGLRVVSEPNPATDDDIVALGAGRIVPWGDSNALMSAVEDAVAQGWDRADLRERALRRLSWGNVARLLVAHARGDGEE